MATIAPGPVYKRVQNIFRYKIVKHEKQMKNKQDTNEFVHHS